MSTYDPEAREWLKRAAEAEKPFGRLVDERGALTVLSAVGELRGAEFKASQLLRGEGHAKWKVVNRSVRSPRGMVRLHPRLTYDYARWDRRDPKARRGDPVIDIDVPRYEPGEKYYPMMEATCGIRVNGAGVECLITELSRGASLVTDKVYSQFYCEHHRQISKVGGGGAEVTLEAGSTVEAKALRGKIAYAVFTVREDEFNAVLGRCESQGNIAGKDLLCRWAQLPVDGGPLVTVAIARSLERGQQAARDIAEKVIRALDPKWILLVGIGGGIPAYEFGLGDVVIACKLVEFSVWAALQGGKLEFAGGGGVFHPDVQALLRNLPGMREALGSWAEAERIVVPRPVMRKVKSVDAPELYGDVAWRQKVMDTINARQRGGKKPVMQVGAVASSDGLIKDAKVMQEWETTSRDLIAVEMELAGIYRAVISERGELPRILGIRGISDVVGYKRSHPWVEYACNSAASLAHQIMRSGAVGLLNMGD